MKPLVDTFAGRRDALGRAAEMVARGAVDRPDFVLWPENSTAVDPFPQPRPWVVQGRLPAAGEPLAAGRPGDAREVAETIAHLASPEEVEEHDGLCVSCRLTRTRPDDDDVDALAAFAEAETQKTPLEEKLDTLAWALTDSALKQFRDTQRAENNAEALFELRQARAKQLRALKAKYPGRSGRFASMA